MEVLLQSRLVLYFVGLVLCFVSHRYLRFEAYYWYLMAAGAGLMLSSTVITLVEMLRKKKAGLTRESKCWLYTLSWQAAVIIGLVLAVWFSHLMGPSATPDTFLEKSLLGGWLLLIILGSFWGVGVEFSHRSSGRGKLAEPKRVYRSGLGWLMVGMVLCTLVCFNYVAARKDKAWDWSYLKTTTPGEATINMFSTLKDPINIALFFPNDSDVKPYVAEYFNFLKDKVDRFNLETYDVQMHPTQAEKYKASRNGQVVLEQNDKRERIDIGEDLKSARSTLKKLDSEVQKVFLRLTEEKRRLYFTRGHQELSWMNRKADALNSVRMLERFLRTQNFSLRFFGVADGSTQAVPDDAAAVVVMGPTTPFLKEEVQVLRDYLKRGGRILFFLDVAKPSRGVPEIIENANDPLMDLLKEAGLSFHRKLLANERENVRATRSPADRWFLFSRSFSSHESVSNLARNDERLAVIAYQMGYFDVEQRKEPWKAYTTIRSQPDTFVDLNKNFNFDKGKEKRKAYSIGTAAVAKMEGSDKEAKIIAVSDASMVSDVLLRNRGNILFVADALRWLVDRVEFSGETASEEDIKIRHTSKEDAIWFNLTVAVVPLFVLLIGFFATRKRKKKVE